MKVMFASDIHGGRVCAERLLDVYREEGAERLFLLGDLLYHGPRNDLPHDYDPKGVISLLNGIKNELLCVRGNCDTEVDQMVLEFPIMAEYAYLSIDGVDMLLTHGHLINADTPHILKEGDILIHGHTHILCAEKFGKRNLYLNPGSVTLPKGGNVRSYMTYENKIFRIKSLENGEIIKEMTV